VIIATDVGRYLAGPFLAACVLLVIAGAAKVTRPEPALVAARAAGLAVPRSGIVAFGVVEVLSGLAGALFGGRAALVVAGSYLVLTFVAARLLIRAPSTPCACLGASNAVVTPMHLVLNVSAALISIGASTAGAPLGLLSENWLAGAAFLVLVACCVKLAALALEVLPELATASRKGST
jgi:hypothetical protein